MKEEKVAPQEPGAPSPDGLIRVDLHCHTVLSFDGTIHLRVLERQARARGLDVVAITDHNEIDAARWAQEHLSIRIIVGEEMRTAAGDIIGLFLKEKIPPDLPLEETLLRIRDQGGLAYLPHPFPGLRANGVAESELVQVASQVDIVEVLNARNRTDWQNLKAQQLAERVGKPKGAGSDAHGPFEIGSAWVEMPDFDGPESFIRSLGRARICGSRISFPVRLYTAGVRRLMRL